MSNSLKYDKINIELRRGKVLELLAKGHSKSEVASKLNVSNALITSDVQFIKSQAQQELQTHIHEKIPYEYSRAITGINNILKRANDILDNAVDTKTQLQTMALLADLYRSILTLATDGGIVEQAMKRVQALQDKPTEEQEQAVLNEHFSGLEEAEAEQGEAEEKEAEENNE